MWFHKLPSIANSAVIAPVMSFSLFSANSPWRYKDIHCRYKDIDIQTKKENYCTKKITEN